jgi:urease accessory protein
MNWAWLTAMVTAALLASPALAHTGAGAGQSLAAGFAHTLFGFDHLLAVLTVGLWAGLAGGRALWAWPAAFVGAMAIGAALGFSHMALPAAEAIVALSLVVIGLAAMRKAPIAVPLGVTICGVFALFHGYAHAAEIPANAGALSYIVGLGAATALLHGTGVVGAIALLRTDRAWLPRLAGGAVAATGVAFFVG